MSGEAQPEPEAAGMSEVVVPEIVESGAPPEEGIRQACPACLKGEAPHRDEKGHFRKGHGSGRGNHYVEIACDELRAAAPRAVRKLIEALDSKQEWISLTAARTIVERAVPAVVTADAARGPLLIFPPGTKMAVMAEVADPGPASMASIGERGARSVYGGGPPKLEEQEQDVEPDLER